MQEPIFENMRFTKPCGAFTDKLKTESKTDLPTDEVDKILEVTAFATVTEKDALAGKIKYGGNVIYQVCYTDKDGNLKKYECGNEYVGVINGDCISDGDDALLKVKTERAVADLSGLKVTVSANLLITADVYTHALLTALSDGEELVVNKQDFPIVKSYGIKSGTYPVEEEFELDFPVKQVLSHCVKGVITNVQCGVGCIIADGEALLSAMYLTDGEKPEIVKQNKALPFRMEIEYEDAMPTMNATARVREKSFKSDISVDGETGKSTVSLSVALIFEGEVFSDESVTLATDAFCVAENLEVACENLSFTTPCEMRSYSRDVTGRAGINELAPETTFVAIGCEKAEVVSTTVKDGEILVDGVLSATGIFRSGENKLFSILLETPFTVTLDGCDCAWAELDVTATVRDGGAKMISLSELELSAEIYFSVYPKKTQSVCYVKSVKSCGEKQKETHAISVYIPLEGEELWSLAKRLNVCPDEVIATNKDLQFPLSGKERIVIFRQMC